MLLVSEAKLARISPRQQGLFYAENGFWYDAMGSFAEVKYASGTNSEWMQMLDSIGLSEFSQIPVIDCCK